MSGNFPLDFLMGERLPSSWYKYFSFCRNTFETVLHLRQRMNSQSPLSNLPSLYAEHR